MVYLQLADPRDPVNARRHSLLNNGRKLNNSGYTRECMCVDARNKVIYYHVNITYHECHNHQ